MGADAAGAQPRRDGGPGPDSATRGDATAIDGGPADSAASDSAVTDSGEVDAGPPVNGCTTFVDRSAATRTLAWDTSVASLPEHCMLIHVGQDVTWLGNLTFHPLGPQGGDLPSPVTAVASGDVATVTFPKAGTYGYVCGVHASMTGAIKVE